MRNCTRLLVVPLLLLGSVRAHAAARPRAKTAPSPSVADGIVGTWRGTSTCTDRVAAPGCNDEQVVYEIAPVAGKANAVTVAADKVVDGKRVPMGTLEFTAGADGTWTTEFETPRVHARSQLAPSGDTMTGRMTLLPSNAVVRRMELRRDKRDPAR